MMISVIVPVFNTKNEYLQDCIDSILKQKYNDFEIIIIDDGSNCECATFLDNISQSNKCISVYHQINSGVSVARNKGIYHSNGDYICFVDSDDVLNDNYFEEAIEGIKKVGADLCIGKTHWFGGEDRDNLYGNGEKYTIYSLDEINNKKNIIEKCICWPKNTIEIQSGLKPEIWCKLYKKDLIKDLSFNSNIKIGEDQLFLVDYLNRCKKICVVDSIWYNYRVFETSSLRKVDEQKTKQYIDFFYAMNSLLQTIGMEDIMPQKSYYMMKELSVVLGFNKKLDLNIERISIIKLQEFFKEKKIFGTMKSVKNHKISFVDKIAICMGLNPVLIKYYLKKLFNRLG